MKGLSALFTCLFLLFYGNLMKESSYPLGHQGRDRTRILAWGMTGVLD